MIVGGGIAGLSAAWRLHKKGFTDFVFLEMNDQAGGNSRWGENEITAYPWAAHYVPVPGPESRFTSANCSKIWASSKMAVGRALSLLRAAGTTLSLWPMARRHRACHRTHAADREQFRRLEDLIQAFRATGKFTVPLEVGLLREHGDLDRISFADWLRTQGTEIPIS